MGTKLVAVCGGRILTCLRDDFAHIPFPDHWDLPGGGAEPGEDAVACILRETFEEFGLRLTPDRLETRLDFASTLTVGGHTSFFGARLREAEIASVRFGDEGQMWAMMEVSAFLAHPKAVPHFKPRLRAVLARMGQPVTD